MEINTIEATQAETIINGGLCKPLPDSEEQLDRAVENSNPPSMVDTIKDTAYSLIDSGHWDHLAITNCILAIMAFLLFLNLIFKD